MPWELPIESVWEYPRPPRVEPAQAPVRVELAGQVIAASTKALRILETSHPPTYYIPPDDVRMELLAKSERATFCEFKGQASYYSIVVGARLVRDAAWSYASPMGGYAALAGYIAFYPSRVDAAYVGDEKVTPQAGDFYGGWITSNLRGPFKGGPGTAGW